MNDGAGRATGLTGAILERLASSVGREHALTEGDQPLPYLREWRDLYRGRAGVVLRPGSTGQVSEIMGLANAQRSRSCRRPATRGWSAARPLSAAKSCCRLRA